MINKKIRESISCSLLDSDIEVVFLDNPAFDNSIIGISNDKLIYRYDLMINEYIKDKDCTYQEAEEFIKHNIIDSSLYLKQKIIIIKDIDYICGGKYE